MSLIKEVVIDQIQITEFGNIQVRQATRIMEDGKEIGKIYFRYVLNPKDSLTGQDERVIAVANAVWTTELLDSIKIMEDNKII